MQLEADHLTFEGGVWVISEEISCRLISRKIILVRKYLGEKISYTENKISFMAYNPGEKILHLVYWGKILLPGV